MNLISLIFKIFERFVPIPSLERARLEEEAREWETKALGSKDVKSLDKAQVLYRNVHKHWYVRLAFAAAYLPLVQYLMNWGQEETEVDDE